MPQPEEHSQNTRIAVISDLHFSTASTPEAEERRLRVAETVEVVNAKRPDLVLSPGDLTENGIAEEFAAVTRCLYDLEAPAYYVPGNHDIGDKWLPDRPGVTPDRMADYETAMGPSWFGCLTAGVHLIGLNASLLGSGLAAEHAQWDWLSAEMAHEPSGPRVIMLHYPPFRSTFDEPAGDYWTVELGARHRLLELALRGRANLIVSGHLHTPLQTDYEGIMMLTAPSVAFGLPFGVQPTGWMMVDISRNGRVTRELIYPRANASSLRE